MCMKNIKTSWDFSGLYYGPTDPLLKKDIDDIEDSFTLFAKKYEKKNIYLSDVHALHKALVDWEKCIEKVGSCKPLWYLSKLSSIDSDNIAINAAVSLLEPRVVKAANKVLFFTIKLGKVSNAQQKIFLQSTKLTHFNYFLTLVFSTAKYDLTEEVEKVMSLKGRPAHDMWIDSFDRLNAQQIVVFKNKKLPLAEAMNMMHQLPTKDRNNLHKASMEVLKTISYFAESEINAIYTNKKINDELRGYKKSYSSTIIGFQNKEKNIEALVKTVVDHQYISHRFFKLKAKLLGLPFLTYADCAVGISKKQKAVPFAEAADIISTSFAHVDPSYTATFKKMLSEGRIDVNPKKGKQGGAYCSGGIGVPTVVLLNYVPSVDAVMTLAHEMGHALHTEIAKKQSPLYQEYTISAAEVASTFFENIAFEHIYKKLSDSEKINALYDRVADYIQTIYRQIACFNFELDLHNQIRDKGALTKEEIAALHNKNMSAYLGNAVKMQELDGYFFVTWSHIRNFFYVYSYAYGALVSRAMYAMYQKDPTYIKKVHAFMEAGGAMSPDDIFKSIGINTSDENFFKQGLLSIEADIIELEKLFAKTGREKSKAVNKSK